MRRTVPPPAAYNEVGAGTAVPNPPSRIQHPGSIPPPSPSPYPYPSSPVCLPQRRLYPRTTDFNNSHPLPLCITMRSRREGKSRGVAGRLSHVMTLIHQEGKWLGTCDSRWPALPKKLEEINATSIKMHPTQTFYKLVGLTLIYVWS